MPLNPPTTVKNLEVLYKNSLRVENTNQLTKQKLAVFVFAKLL